MGLSGSSNRRSNVGCVEPRDASPALSIVPRHASRLAILPRDERSADRRCTGPGGCWVPPSTRLSLHLLRTSRSARRRARRLRRRRDRSVDSVRWVTGLPFQSVPLASIVFVITRSPGLMRIAGGCAPEHLLEVPWNEAVRLRHLKTNLSRSQNDKAQRQPEWMWFHQCPPDLSLPARDFPVLWRQRSDGRR